MKKFQMAILLIFVTSFLVAQSSLKVGDKASKINITDYILNAPKDKNIENKFIVLEFWATWCAPCLAAVPHLNELQNKFKNRKDLLFISLTNEKPTKTTRTLSKIKFTTIVVSDQTEITEKNFDVQGLPHTVLIDNKGIIKWIGGPESLNSDMITELLNGRFINDKKPIVDLSTGKSEEIAKVVSNSDNGTDIFKIIKDKDIKYLFSLKKSAQSGSNTAINALIKGTFIDTNNSLKVLLSKISKIPEFSVVIDGESSNQNYELIYKNTNSITPDDHLKDVKDNLLKALNLKEIIESKKVDAYILKIDDAKKLSISTDEKYDGSHSGENQSHFIFSNETMESVVKKISQVYDILVIDETNLKDKVDFLFKRGNLTTFISELNEYGLILEKSSKDVEFYTYKNQLK